MGKTLGYGEITVANMTEPFTVMLTNEAQQFATDSNRKVTSAQSYYTDIIVIRGSQERTDYIIGNITSGSGITVSKSCKRVTFSVSAGATIGADTGVIEIPITLDGQTVKKQFSWSCGKQGPQGVKGTDGNSFAWNMLSETNCGKKHWGTESSGGKYSVEDFITEDNINAVKLICTEGISTSNWSYVLFKDIKMLNQLKPSTKYTLSYDIKANRSGAISHSICKGDVSNFCTNTVVVNNIIGNETWQHISVVLTTNDLKTTPTNEILYLGRNALSKVGYSIIKNLKLTEGIVDTPWGPSQSDIEGKGVVETVQYYLATSQTSGVTSSTSGWSTDITTQKLTADKKYLWNCYQTKYSDGTSEPITTPTIIGVYGDKGNGIVASVQRPNKTEFWWSQVGAVGHKDTFDDSSNTRNNCRVGDIFTVMGTSTEGNSHTVYYKSTTDSGDLAGECINHVIAESGADAKNLSITPSSQYFKSTDGGKTFAPNQITITPTIQGEINFGKWQYSIDGGVSFADAVSGQKGLTISNNVLTVNKDSSLYSDAVTMVTFRAVASDSSFYDTCSIAKLYDVSDIGDGRNLLWNSNFAKTDEAINTSTYTTWGLILRGNTYTATIDTSVKHNNFNTLKVIGTKAGENGGQDLIYRIKGLNLDEIKFTETGVKYTLSFYAKASIACNFSARYAYDSYAKDTNVALSADWKRYEIQMHPTTTSYQTSLIFKMDAASTVWFSEFKLEKGSSATGYSTAPEDVQTAILSTKNSIDSVSSKVDTNTKSIQDKVSKTTYERELTLVKGDLSKANEGLNKWRYEIYPKSLFDSEDQSKSTIDIFARNLNLVPSQTVLLDDASLSTEMYYGDRHIAYALTFVKMSTKKNVTTKMFNDDGASLYVNGGLISSRGGDLVGTDVTFTLMQGWNCLEVVVNEQTAGEGFRFSTTLSKLSECQMMNCYYGTPVARQSRITNQLVDVTKNLTGVTSTVQDVMTAVGNSGNITEFKNNYSKWKQSVDKIEQRVGETYVTNDKFDNLQIGGRNLVKNSAKWNFTQYILQGAFIQTIIEDSSAASGHCIKIECKSAGRGIYSYPISNSVDSTGKVMTISFYAKCNNSGRVCTTGIENGGKFQHTFSTEWEKITHTYTATKNYYAFILYDFWQTGDILYIKDLKIEYGNKPTDWTPAPEDDEINGQNLVSNLPANWEQGTVTEGSAVGTTYANTKSASAGSIRPKELIPVSGYITISTAYSNQSQKPIRHWIAAYDVNKNYLGVNYVSNSWNSFPRTLDMKDAKYLAIMVGYTDSSAITPSDISKICLKIERGTSATQFTLAPEDVNGKIQSVETIATQTADKFSWLVKSGTSSSNFELTDKTATLVADKINMDGLVTFNGLDSSARDRINTVTSGNLITVTPANPKSDYGGGQTYNVIADDKGGRCVQWNSSCASFLLLNSYTPVNFTSSDQLYYDIRVPNWSSTTFDTKLTIWFYNKNKALITSASKTLTLKSTIWNHFTGYLTLPSSSNWGDLYYYIIGLTNPNKQAIGFTNDSYIEKVNSYATAYAKNAVDWVGQNGTNTNNMYNMVSKWTDGAVSDTTQINGGWIKANTITASKIAIGDFTNYCQLNKNTASSYGFTATDDTKGVWFTASPIDRDKDISQWFTCEGSQKLYVEYDLSTTVKGKVNASDTGTSYLTSGIMIFAANGTKEIISYTRSKGVTATSDGTVTHISLVETLPADARFFRVVLQTDGKRNTFSGTLKIRDPQVRKATTGKLIVDGSITANKIATDAIKSRNYISSGGTQGSFLNLSDGSFKSPNLSWDSNGNLIATNANLSGKITATKGKIGNLNLENSLYLKNNEMFTIGSYNAKKVFGQNNDGDIYLSKEGISTSAWNTGETYIGDSGSIKADTTDSSGVCLTEGLIKAYYSTYCKDYPTAYNTCIGTLIGGGSIIFSSYNEDGLVDAIGTMIKYDKIATQRLEVSSNDPSNVNAIETTGDAIIGGNCLLRDRSNGSHKIGIYPYDGCIEMYGDVPYIDFHYGCSTSDYTSRIIAQHNWDCLSFTGSILLGGYIYNSSNGHYTWDGRTDAYLGCGNYNNTNNIYYYAGYHAFYVNGDSGSGMMYIETSGVSSRKGFRNSSDERIKQNFSHFDDNFIDTYMNLEPVQYQFKNDTNDKYHFGFKAQQTERILNAYGEESDKSYGICATHAINPEKAEKLYGVKNMHEEYTLAYDELIAPTTYMVQHTYKELESTKGELAKVKQEKENLEARLQAIEAKLGL